MDGIAFSNFLPLRHSNHAPTLSQSICIPRYLSTYPRYLSCLQSRLCPQGPDAPSKSPQNGQIGLQHSASDGSHGISSKTPCPLQGNELKISSIDFSCSSTIRMPPRRHEVRCTISTGQQVVYVTAINHENAGRHFSLLQGLGCPPAASVCIQASSGDVPFGNSMSGARLP